MRRSPLFRRLLPLAAAVALAVLFVAALAAPAAADQATAAASDERCVSHCDCEPGSLCTREGVCRVAICPFIYAPVCGLDKVTYGNRCQAEAAHVVVAHDGPCEQVCGGIQGLTCPDESYVCDLPEGMCRGADLQGVCKRRPEACTREYRPVCGCDGKTYGNDCMRLMADVTKKHDGECADPVRSCRNNGDCGRNEYCASPLGVCSREPGECRPRPQICLDVWIPVCGCDGETYSNACYAARAGVSVASEGACR